MNFSYDKKADAIAFVINPGTPLGVKYNIFQRINTLGLRLKAQEVRNALYRGVPSNFTKASLVLAIWQ